MKTVLAIDIGGSAVKYAVINENADFVERGSVPAPRASEKKFVDTISSLYKQFEKQVSGIGISMAGKLNPEDGVIVSSGQYPFLRGKSLSKLISEYCGTNVSVENDAHSAAIAELNKGSLVGVRHAAVIVLGTGIGGAIILDGKIYNGNRFCAAEFSLIRRNGKPGIENSWMYKGGGAVGLINIVKEELNIEEDINGRDIFRMAEEKNPKVLKAIDIYNEMMAVQIYNLQTVLDLEVYAIGGGISAQPSIINGIEKHLEGIFKAEEKYALPPTMPKITACAFCNDANLIGAWYDFNCRGF